MNISSLFLMQIVILSLAGLSGCSLPHMYKGEEVHGWVVDADTKEPLKDVVVMINWGLKGGWHLDHTGYLVIEETLTDESGYYEFGSWGPMFTTDELSMSAPELLFVKVGYLPRGFSNQAVSPGNRPLIEYSEWTGKTIELRAYDDGLDGGINEYVSIVSGFADVLRLSSGREALRCVWEKVPRYSAEIINYGTMFNKKGVKTSLPDINRFVRNDCNDAQIVLGKYLGG